MTQVKVLNNHQFLIEIICKIINQTPSEKRGKVIILTRELGKNFSYTFLRKHVLRKIPTFVRINILTPSNPSSNYRGKHQTDKYEITSQFCSFIHAIQTNTGQPASKWKNFNVDWINYLDQCQLLNSKRVGFAQVIRKAQLEWRSKYDNQDITDTLLLTTPARVTQSYQTITIAPSINNAFSIATQAMSGVIAGFLRGSQSSIVATQAIIDTLKGVNIAKIASVKADKGTLLVLHYARLQKTTGISYDQITRIYGLSQPTEVNGVKKVLTTSGVLIDTARSNIIYFNPTFLTFLRAVYKSTAGTIIATTDIYNNIPAEWWKVLIRCEILQKPDKAGKPYSAIRTSLKSK